MRGYGEVERWKRGKASGGDNGGGGDRNDDGVGGVNGRRG